MNHQFVKKVPLSDTSEYAQNNMTQNLSEQVYYANLNFTILGMFPPSSNLF